jgi:hypothetical protein
MVSHMEKPARNIRQAESSKPEDSPLRELTIQHIRPTLKVSPEINGKLHFIETTSKLSSNWLNL